LHAEVLLLLVRATALRESTTLLRKSFATAISTWVKDDFLQAYAGTWLLVLSLGLQLIAQPFATPIGV
jgi:hypothetical protein